MWFFAALLVLAMGGVAVVAAGRGAPLSEAYDDRVDATVPADGPVTADDLRRIRFPLAFRGYRMQEVDALLDRLATERERRDAEQADAEQLDGAPADEPPTADGGAERA
ncbi:MAG TPA: DivIVA domain-containing protein [Nocardioides sp.]|uniref:DivIVA domain-containing protein n=1 Tax=Nocardioides sp. TaxID=35761 RepID=UPI002B7D2664|nr:DivIVA domain-containing protein [Nocardioides sp.]HTW15765.1 DivIVA domain-containing protein [Nocardioides sp.]